MNLETLSLHELLSVEKSLKLEIRKRHDVACNDLYKEMTLLAGYLKVPLRGLVEIAYKTNIDSMPPPLYFNPDDATQVWRGIGKKPRWLREWLKAGKSLDVVRF